MSAARGTADIAYIFWTKIKCNSYGNVSFITEKRKYDLNIYKQGLTGVMSITYSVYSTGLQ